MSIRKAEISDAAKIKDLVSSLSHFYLKDKYGSLPPWFSETLEISEFQTRLSNTEFINFVYLVNNSIIGYISVKGKSHLYHLFVSEEYQGKGISKRLWSHAMSTLGSSIYSVRSSIYAIPVYESFGFKISEVASTKDGIGFQPMELIL